MRPFDRRLLTLAPDARPAIVGLSVLAAGSGLAAIAQAFAVSGLVVALVRGEPLLTPAGWVLAAFAARGILGGATELLAAHAGTAVSASLRSRLSDALVRADADTRARLGGTGATTLLHQGASSVEPYVARYLPALVAAAVLPAAAVVAMAGLDWVTALIPVLTLPLLPLFAALIGVATRDATKRRWQALAALSGHFLDVMRGLPTLLTYGRARRQVGTIEAVSDEHRHATVATLRVAFLSSAALEFLATISVAIVAVWTGIALAQGSMELHVALPLILLAPEAYWPIRRVGAEFHNAADGAQAVSDLAHAIETAEAAARRPERSSSAAGPGAPADAVVADSVSYRYAQNGPDVVAGLDLRAGTGLTVLTGPSGAGKTTVLELLAGLRAPTGGTVQAPRAHLVTQRPFLAPVSLRDNLRLGAPAGLDDAALRAALEEVGLAPLLGELPDGLSTTLGDDGFGLSAGQRARLATARALLSDAPLVLLDEPTAHLDPDAELTLHRAVARLARRRIVVAVTHREGLLALADARVDLAPAPAGGPR